MLPPAPTPLYPEAGGYIIFGSPSLGGVHGLLQYTQKVAGLSLHAIPQSRLGERGSWLTQAASFPDDWEVAPNKKKKRDKREILWHLTIILLCISNITVYLPFILLFV